MNLWQEAAPHAQVMHGQLGCDISLNDLSLRTPRAFADNEVLDRQCRLRRPRID